MSADNWTLADLRRCNTDRQAAWCPDQVLDLSFRGNELAGETGEACNVIKKLERERLGWRGSRATREQLAEELADVVICADLAALTAGVDLMAAVKAKFDATSDKVGLPHRLVARSPLPPSAGGDEVREAHARAIYEAMGFAYEGRTVGARGPYGDWAKALKAADAIAALASAALHGPFGYLVIVPGLDEEHWRASDDREMLSGYISIPMFTKVDPFEVAAQAGQAEARQDGTS